jgi:hypothetical protein
MVKGKLAQILGFMMILLLVVTEVMDVLGTPGNLLDSFFEATELADFLADL